MSGSRRKQAEVLVTWKAVMATQNANRKYDRDFLLSREKRNQIVELWEVEKYGRDCFNDPNHVHLYGMPPKEWYQRGVRILARTCLEAVKDPLGNKIGSDIAEVVARTSGNRVIGVVDPFAGSCNGLYAILRHLPGARGIGFEVEPAVFELTTRNVARLNAPIELVRGSYKNLVGLRKHSADHLIVVFLGPPWGDALQPDTGLHLDRTKPPILEIVRDFEQVYGAQPVLYVTEVHEVNEPKALKRVEAAFDWSELRIYDVNVPGLQHGVLLGTLRWSS
jgi:16S rRNA G966 N2-methylase RsmD